jgi:hypothetical protein
VCAVACVPAACARGGDPLASVPIPKQALGPGAGALSLLADSGVDSNAEAARNAGRGVTAADLERAGRMTGYTLDYALPPATRLRTGQTLLGVQTIAERYRNASAARKGLAFWRGVTRARNGSAPNGVKVVLTPFEAHVGDGSYAYLLTYRRAGRPLAYIGDVVFRSGDLLGAVFVTASDAARLRARTVALAEKLAARMRHAHAAAAVR